MEEKSSIVKTFALQGLFDLSLIHIELRTTGGRSVEIGGADGNGGDASAFAKAAATRGQRVACVTRSSWLLAFGPWLTSALRQG